MFPIIGEHQYWGAKSTIGANIEGTKLDIPLVDRPATQKLRFNKPASNMGNFHKNSLYGSQMTNRATLWRPIKVGFVKPIIQSEYQF